MKNTGNSNKNSHTKEGRHEESEMNRGKITNLIYFSRRRRRQKRRLSGRKEFK